MTGDVTHTQKLSVLLRPFITSLLTFGHLALQENDHKNLLWFWIFVFCFLCFILLRLQGTKVSSSLLGFHCWKLEDPTTRHKS